MTIILTTHDLKDIEEICPRMLIVNKGKLVYDGLVSGLRDKIGNEQKITIVFRNDPRAVKLPGAELLHDNGIRKTFLFDRGHVTAFEWISRFASQYDVEDVSIEDADIESVIRTLYKQLEVASSTVVEG